MAVQKMRRTIDDLTLLLAMDSDSDSDVEILLLDAIEKVPRPFKSSFRINLDALDDRECIELFRNHAVVTKVHVFKANLWKTAAIKSPKKGYIQYYLGKAYRSDMFDDKENYVILLDDCKEALFMPGSSKEFFELERYQKEIGKDYKRVVLYLCTESDMKEANDALEMGNSSDDENQTKQHTVSSDEEGSTHHDFDSSSNERESNDNIPESQPRKKHRSCDGDGIDENVEKGNERKVYKDTKELLDDLQSRVDQSSTLQVVARRGIPLDRLIHLYCRAASRHNPESALKVTYIGEEGDDSGALKNEFLTTAITEIGTKLLKKEVQ
ncbi:hypothetical protein AC249_AIPGENE11449 [Exaiptasia diaphana]|nr:hypothetical protein AC249_AIPGENE11449 [Exaiptasia diaphana]